MHRNIRVLLLALCVTAVLGEDFDPTFSHGDFMRNFNKTYQDHERAAHEAAFRNNYAELLRLHGEGRDVAVNERLDWTDGEKGGTFAFILSLPELQTPRLGHSPFHPATDGQCPVCLPHCLRLEELWGCDSDQEPRKLRLLLGFFFNSRIREQDRDRHQWHTL